MKFQGHQGDVFFEDISHLMGEIDLSSLKLVKPDNDGETTIVMGEATNHHHRARCDVYEFSKMDNVSTYICHVKEAANLQHYHVKEKRETGEHDVIPLHKGLYIVRTQRQADLEGLLFPVVD